jgi:group I intron endonuclease
MIYIYTLSHPITNEVRYVGKTINVLRRFKQHLHDKRNSHKASWVKSLKSEGLKPIMTILETCTDNWQEREIFWISQYDNLTNHSLGGGVDYIRTTTEETKEKLRQANIGKEKSKEHKAKISQSILKKKIIPTNRKRVYACGVIYESIIETAKSLGLNISTIKRRIKKDNFPDWYFV